MSETNNEVEPTFTPTESVTPNLNLPIFGDKDKPTFRGHINYITYQIDRGFAALNGKIGDVLVNLKSLGDDIERLNEHSPFFDIRDYGASTENVDNSRNIQAAIDAAEASGGVVFIPRGVWNVKAKSQTIIVKSGVTIQGESRESSIIRVHESSGDWAYLFVYGGAMRDNVRFTNLTIDAATNVNPTGTDTGWTKARTIFHLIGKNISVTDCTLKCNGTWCGHFVGDNMDISRNRITVDMSSYYLGTFDQSIIWASGKNGRIENNRMSTVESDFTVRTAIEFQGHNFAVKGNSGGKFQNGIIFTAQTYAQSNYYTNDVPGAIGNTIENNSFTFNRSGVEIWGMVIPTPGVIRGTSIRNNEFNIDNTGAAPLTPPAAVSFRIGRVGAGGQDGPQTTPVDDLKITGNRVVYSVRNTAPTTYTTWDVAFRLYTEIRLTNVVVSDNEIYNCGGAGILAYTTDNSSVWIDGLDISNNRFINVREPVWIVKGVRNWSVTNCVFRQDKIYPTRSDNMLYTVQSRPATYTGNVNGTIKNNSYRCVSGHKPFYPRRDQETSASIYPASRGYELEDSLIQFELPNKAVTIGSAGYIHRLDNTLVKAQYSLGATIGKLLSQSGDDVKIVSVADNQTMTVSDASNIEPGQVIKLPFGAPFAAGSAIVLNVLNNVVTTAAGQLVPQSGHSLDEATGAVLSYYSNTVPA